MEAELNSMRKQASEKGNLGSLFEKYHKCIKEIEETNDMLQEAKEEKDPDL